MLFSPGSRAEQRKIELTRSVARSQSSKATASPSSSSNGSSLRKCRKSRASPRRSAARVGSARPAGLELSLESRRRNRCRSPSRRTGAKRHEIPIVVVLHCIVSFLFEEIAPREREILRAAWRGSDLARRGRVVVHQPFAGRCSSTHTRRDTERLRCKLGKRSRTAPVAVQEEAASRSTTCCVPVFSLHHRYSTFALTCATMDTSSPPGSPSATVTRPRNGPVQLQAGMDPLPPPRGSRRAATTCPRRRSREVVIRRRIWDGQVGRGRVVLEEEEEEEANRVRWEWRTSLRFSRREKEPAIRFRPGP